jgi:hypothetical protein
MKRILLLATLFCAIAGTALAAASENALKAMALGNQKHVLEQTLAAGPLAVIVADAAIQASPADLFGMDESRIGVVTAPFDAKTGLTVTAKDIVTPLILILGQEEAAVWAVYANTVKASPDLIHAAMKGQVTVLGALLDAESGAVTILGAHPDLSVLVGQYLLGITTETEAAPETKVEEAATPADQPAATAEEKHEDAKVAPAPEAGHDEAKAASQAEPASGGGGGFLGVILFIAALIGTVVFLDKTVLKP